jgi:hypothetical protein
VNRAGRSTADGHDTEHLAAFDTAAPRDECLVSMETPSRHPGGSGPDGPEAQEESDDALLYSCVATLIQLLDAE